MISPLPSWPQCEVNASDVLHVMVMGVLAIPTEVQ